VTFVRRISYKDHVVGHSQLVTGFAINNLNDLRLEKTTVAMLATLSYPVVDFTHFAGIIKDYAN